LLTLEAPAQAINEQVDGFCAFRLFWSAATGRRFDLRQLLAAVLIQYWR
jgi:hypothetical protein